MDLLEYVYWIGALVTITVLASHIHVTYQVRHPLYLAVLALGFIAAVLIWPVTLSFWLASWRRWW